MNPNNKMSKKIHFAKNKNDNDEKKLLVLILEQKILIEDEGLFRFLSEVAQEKQDFANKLMYLVFNSKNVKTNETDPTNNGTIIAAANAISILISANVSFSGLNMRNLNISGATLRDGNFNGSDFTEADLTGVVLENCKLFKTIFNKTIMKDIKLGINSDIQTNDPVTSCCFSNDIHLNYGIVIPAI